MIHLQQLWMDSIMVTSYEIGSHCFVWDVTLLEYLLQYVDDYPAEYWKELTNIFNYI